MEKLVGIARLAAQSPLLEQKRRVRYFELPTRSFIGRSSNAKMPFQWTINPYRGCEFGCKYCYARYAHEFMELREAELFETQIYAKRWSAEAFRKELLKIDREDAIALGTATDPYQPAERRYRITRRMLEVFDRDGGRDLSITTKSDLIARDAALLSSIARRNVLHVHMTVTTMDPELARLVEPFAPRPDLRIAAVAKLSTAGIRVGIFANPIMPLLNDREDSLEKVAEAASAAGARYFSGGTLFLKPCSQQVFFPFLEERFPHLVRRYRERFGAGAYLKGDYPERMRERVARVREKYRLTERLGSYQPEQWEGEPQLELFGLDVTASSGPGR
jgi:DNA repair photolyase